MKRSLLLITIGWLLAVTATAAPPFYSHYWVEGSVSEEGVPSARRQVEVYKTPDNKITGLTDASGRYQINLYDLEYFRGVPVTYESESYTVVVPATEGGLGGSESVLLRSVRGFVTTIFSFFRPGSGDVTPPRVTAFEPHGSNVSPSEVIRITFSELMSQEVTEKAISLRPLTGVYYEWQHVGDGDRPYSELYLLPVTSWQPGKSYLVTIGTGAADRAGNRMTEPETRSFTTLYGKGIDRVRPVIIATSPRDGDREVSLRTSVAILFSEAMSKEATVRAVSLPVKGAPWRANWIGSKLIFTPGQMLDLNALYEFTVSALACDLAGNRLAEDRHFTFRTLTAPPDVTPPTVISVSGGMNVALRPYIGIVFSEAMAPATINEVQLRLLDPGGNQVACDINYEAEINTAYLLPQADLLSYSGYTVVVRTGVTDLWENHLEREYRTTFVTADTAGPAIEKVKFDGRGYVENDVIASDALVSAEVTDSVGVNYNYLKLKLGPSTQVERADLKASDVYENGGLLYKITPAIEEGSYVITIEAADVGGNRGIWQGKVKVYTGDVRLVPGTVAFAAPATISPVRAQAAGEEVRASMVYNLTGSADIDLQIYGPAGRMIWARRFARGTMGGLAGYNAVVWNGRDAQEKITGNGIYTFRVVRGGRSLGVGYIIVSD